MVLRYQNRQEQLGREEATHYFATVAFREEHFQVLRMEDEVVLATVGSELFLSHPQSELWLNQHTVTSLLQIFGSLGRSEIPADLPEWLSVSSSAGRLLLSDQRSGRWVLLGLDHIRELDRRLELQKRASPSAVSPQPPTVSLKGVTVHLQSATTLAQALEEFAATGRFKGFTDRTPRFWLSARETTGGIEIDDGTSRTALTAKEARKWIDIIRGELTRLNFHDMSRGRIRTVFADAEAGRWVLQWGDEVLVPHSVIGDLTSNLAYRSGSGKLAVKQNDDICTLLAPSTGDCVALQEKEVKHMLNVAGECKDTLT
jgi:hypothetical protein